MAENSAIEWCHHTANFWWGCMKVSPGCQNCYADTWAQRWGKDIWGPAQITDREYKKGVWKAVKRWNKQAVESGERKRVFCMSMGDFFEDHPQVSEWRNQALELIDECTGLDWLMLTKRPENVLSMISYEWQNGLPPHVWMMTSVENQQTADERIPHLLRIPAAVRGLSMEPLLGRVDLRSVGEGTERGLTSAYDALTGTEWQYSNIFGGGNPLFDKDEMEEYGEGRIHWVIVGGESGHGARPFDLTWAYSIVNQCEATGVPVFVKQLGANPTSVQRGYEIKDKKGGNWHEWPDDLRIREFPKTSVGIQS